MAGSCAVCHSGPMLNETNEQAPRALGLPKGMRIGNAGVSEQNHLKLPTYTFEIHDRGSIVRVKTPDIGILMTDLTFSPLALEMARVPNAPLLTFANMFKTPTLWGVKNTAPYFHDNSAKDFDELLDHYNLFFESIGIGKNALTPQMMTDIKAFLNLL